jgi:hypothetical protein
MISSRDIYNQFIADPKATKNKRFIKTTAIGIKLNYRVLGLKLVEGEPFIEFVCYRPAMKKITNPVVPINDNLEYEEAKEDDIDNADDYEVDDLDTSVKKFGGYKKSKKNKLRKSKKIKKRKTCKKYRTCKRKY